MKRILRSLAVAALALGVTAPVVSAAPGPDYMASDNVELVSRLKQAGDGVGGKVVGDYLYVTSTTHLLIFDIKTNPEAPEIVGVFTLNVEWENEEVPTNGKILGISASAGCVPVDPAGLPQASANCLAIYDVSDPANVTLLDVVGDAGDHTSDCVLDCTYFYGDSGTITDARNPKDAKLLEQNWYDSILERYGIETKNGCHHVREISPGVILGSCNPVMLFSVLPEHGGSITEPALLAQGIAADATLIHSSRWPRAGRDKFVLVGQETNATGVCDDTSAAFQTWDGSKVVNPGGGFFAGTLMTQLDDYRPTSGTYSDGNSPYNALGCSVHWFQEHPTFRNGGLVAVAAYENGTRFLQVGPDGNLTEQGYFLPASGSTSAPHWHPNGKVVYAIDYTRGIDVLRYTGDTYVPNDQGQVVPTPGTTPGTGGATDAPACASAAGFRHAKATPRGAGVFFDVAKREDRPFTVDVFQQSQGKRVVKERLVARFRNKTGSFAWNGKDRKKRTMSSGNYFARFTMKTGSGVKDTRRVTLSRARGKFRKAPDFYQRVDCGTFKSLKLGSSAFGGRTKEKLGISYQLAIPVKSVRIQVKVGKKIVKTINGKGAHRKTFRYSLPARIARAGQRVKVVVQAQRQGQAYPPITLTAKRL